MGSQQALDQLADEFSSAIFPTGERTSVGGIEGATVSVFY